jgi:hypothetical protein
MSQASLAELLGQSSRAGLLSLSAGLLQIYDFWDESHEAAQEADDLGERAYSAYWHGIAHRREPDPGNAAYWFRRVGRHPVFKPLADAAQGVLDEMPAGRPIPFLRKGVWDAFAFIDYCDSAPPASAEEAIARRIQRLEMGLLLDATAGAALGI